MEIYSNRDASPLLWSLNHSCDKTFFRWICKSLPKSLLLWSITSLLCTPPTCQPCKTLAASVLRQRGRNLSTTIGLSFYRSHLLLWQFAEILQAIVKVCNNIPHKNQKTKKEQYSTQDQTWEVKDSCIFLSMDLSTGDH